MRTARLLSIGALLGLFVSPLGAALPSRGVPGGTMPAAAGAVFDALRLSPEVPELRARPALVDRLRETPHNYFRFVNRPFSTAVCGVFDDLRGGLPDVNLHGDAHIEQYAVTSLGRGLVDFDDSARGPYVIDLVRFGVSLELAARQKGWRGGGRAFDDFLRGYRDALANPSLDPPPYRAIGRARSRFAFDHGLALRRADALMDSDPVPVSDLERDLQGYVAEMRTETPATPPGFFRLKKAGRLRMGIGSALDEKYLLRIEGRTAEEEDDQILEVKAVHALPDGGCVHTDLGPQRVPLGMALIANASLPFSGILARGHRFFWVHGWTDDYVELSIESSISELRDLREVAYDVGVQLGRAHPKGAPGRTSSRALRRVLLESTLSNEARIRRAIDELTEATVAAWKAFRGGRQEASDVDLQRACDQPTVPGALRAAHRPTR
jgi:hypothetical protein